MTTNTSGNLNITVTKDLEESKIYFGRAIETCAKEAIISRDCFKIAVSGGSLVNALVEILPRVRVNFSKWKIFFCDERLVPFDDPESTYGLYKKKLIGLLPQLTEDNFVIVNTSLSAAEAAVDYEKKLRQHFPYEYKDPNPNYFPRFDLLLLGLGPDGHTCSLFPGHPLLKERKLWIAPITDSPKPPPERVTITYPVINHARNIILYMTGSGKADILKRILVDCEKLPGYYINTTLPNSPVHWILDPEAAKLLPTHETPYLKQFAMDRRAASTILEDRTTDDPVYK